MKRMLKLSLAYLRYYKKQTFSLFLGVLLSATFLGESVPSSIVAGRRYRKGQTGLWGLALLLSKR